MIGKTNAVIGGSGGGELEQLVNYAMAYDAGDECTDLTGGWEGYNQNNGTPSATGYYNKISKESDHLSMNCNAGSSGRYYPSNAIDLSGYKYVGTVTDTLKAWQSVGINAIFITSAKGESTAVKSYVSPEGTALSNDVGLCDVSGLTGKYYTQIAVYKKETNVRHVFMVKEDNWQEWLIKGGLTVGNYASLDAVLADTTALSTLMNNADAVNYMLKKCTGTVMASVIQSAYALEAIRDSQYNAEIFANEHWCKFLEMVGESVESNKLYLYNEGDECTDITGGWGIVRRFNSTGWSIGTLTKNTNNMFVDDTPNKNASVLMTKKAVSIDTVKKYSKLFVLYKATNVQVDSAGNPQRENYLIRAAYDTYSVEENTGTGQSPYRVTGIFTADSKICADLSDGTKRDSISINKEITRTQGIYISVSSDTGGSRGLDLYIYKIWLE